jgi:hypothetical protein
MERKGIVEDGQITQDRAWSGEVAESQVDDAGSCHMEPDLMQKVCS